MARPVSIIQDEIRTLSDSDKEAVLRVLLEELDGPPDGEVDTAWISEAQRRSKEIDNGTVKCVPAADVFANLDALLKK